MSPDDRSNAGVAVAGCLFALAIHILMPASILAVAVLIVLWFLGEV